MWYGLVEKETGRLHSLGTVLSPEISAAYEVVELGDDFDARGQHWDEHERRFMPGGDPMVELLISAFVDQPVLRVLGAGDKEIVRASLRKLIYQGQV